MFRNHRLLLSIKIIQTIFIIDCIELLHRIFVSVPSGYFDFMVNNVGLYCIMSRTLIQFPRMQRKGRPWPWKFDYCINIRMSSITSFPLFYIPLRIVENDGCCIFIIFNGAKVVLTILNIVNIISSQ